jgi:hypothetical protein
MTVISDLYYEKKNKYKKKEGMAYEKRERKVAGEINLVFSLRYMSQRKLENQLFIKIDEKEGEEN